MGKGLVPTHNNLNIHIENLLSGELQIFYLTLFFEDGILPFLSLSLLVRTLSYRVANV